MGDCENYEKGSIQDCKRPNVESVCVLTGHFLITVLENCVGLRSSISKTLGISLVTSLGAPVLYSLPFLACLMKKILDVCDMAVAGRLLLNQEKA